MIFTTVDLTGHACGRAWPLRLGKPVIGMGIDVPDGPEGPEPGEDRVVVDDDDMEFVAHKRGRPRKLQGTETLEKLVQMYFVERMSMREVADNLGVSHMSVYRMLCDPAIELLI
jgi:hypothetical protein